MTSLNLNLLPSQAKFQAKKIRLIKIAKRYTLIFASIWVTVVVVVLGVSMLVGWMVSRERLKLEIVAAEVKALDDRAMTGWRLKYIAGMVVKAMGSRFEYGKTFDLVNGLLPGDIGAEDMELRDNKTFMVSGRTSDRGVIDMLEKKVTEIGDGGVEGFGGAKFTNLTYSQGWWNYGLELKLK